MEGSEDRSLARRLDRLTELPMLLLALAYLPVFLIGYLPGVPASTVSAAALAENVIIALFAAELVVKVAVADRKLAYLRGHWLDMVIVAVPFLRPFRLLRVVQFLPFLARGAVGLRQVMGPYRGAYVLTIGMVSVLLSSVLVTLFERDADGSIKGFGDALWWAVTTITTVGYGDKFPVTAEGRAVAVFLMVVGITLFGVLTAAVAAYFVQGEAPPEKAVTTEDLMAKLEALEARIEEQRKSLEALIHTGRVDP